MNLDIPINSQMNKKICAKVSSIRRSAKISLTLVRIIKPQGVTASRLNFTKGASP